MPRLPRHPAALGPFQRGFRLAFNHTVPAPVYLLWQPLADYVKLDLMVLKPGQLPMPLGQALALLPLPPAVVEALEHGTGIYGPLLALTRACEGDDDTAFHTAADVLQFRSHHTNMAHMEALVGADTLSI